MYREQWGRALCGRGAQIAVRPRERTAPVRGRHVPHVGAEEVVAPRPEPRLWRDWRDRDTEDCRQTEGPWEAPEPAEALGEIE